MDSTLCNRCGQDLTGHDGRKRIPCPNCGSLTRRYEVNLELRTSTALHADATVSLPTIDMTAQVFAPTIVAERLQVDLHFEHVIRTWQEGDGCFVTVTSPNDMPFAAIGGADEVRAILRAAADAIADEID